MRRRLPLVLAAVLAAQTAGAEVSLVNLHLQPGVLIDFKQPSALGGGVFGLDLAPGQGMFAISAHLFGLAGAKPALVEGTLFGGGIGVRLRLFNDETGFAFGSKGKAGSAMSNLFIEAHLDYEHGGFGLGADVGLGLELSPFDGVLVAPKAQMFFNSFSEKFEPALMFGLEFSFGIPYDPGSETDNDGDGILAGKDKCPSEAEDKDGFEDNDGCPDEDNDKDGVPDEKDKCPNVPGEKTGKPDDTGCPIIPDDDGDGVPNDKDKCRMEKEDKDGFEDSDGCPDPDNDKDGIPDGRDKCPNVAEDKDGFQDDDGCPDLDDDADGVPDEKDKCPTAAGPASSDGCPVDLDKDKDGVLEPADKCPTEAETVNGVDDEDGCPEKDAKAWVTQGRIVTAERITFAAGAEQAGGKSAATLDAVAQVLAKLPGLKKVRIDGFADDPGDDAKNLALSDKRAQAVLKALTGKKVAKDRLEAKGQGKARPVSKEATDAGKDLNRRVEFVVVEGAPAAK